MSKKTRLMNLELHRKNDRRFEQGNNQSSFQNHCFLVINSVLISNDKLHLLELKGRAMNLFFFHEGEGEEWHLLIIPMLSGLRQEDGCKFLTLTSLGYKFQAIPSYRERHCLKKRRKKGKNLRSSPPDVRACSFDTQTLTAAPLFLPQSLPPSPFQLLLLLFMFFF